MHLSSELIAEKAPIPTASIHKAMSPITTFGSPTSSFTIAKAPPFTEKSRL
jgi:hypothetical protein